MFSWPFIWTAKILLNLSSKMSIIRELFADYIYIFSLKSEYFITKKGLLFYYCDRIQCKDALVFFFAPKIINHFWMISIFIYIIRYCNISTEIYWCFTVETVGLKFKLKLKPKPKQELIIDLSTATKIRKMNDE